MQHGAVTSMPSLPHFDLRAIRRDEVRKLALRLKVPEGTSDRVGYAAKGTRDRS